jgi:F0F1-type ATP synthase assembly protein I
MKQQNPLSLAQLSGAGMSIISSVIAGFALGWLASHYLHWDWAVPLGVLLGFIAGFFSLFRQLGVRM